MLKVVKNVTLTGQSMIDGMIGETYTATIDSNNPQNMSLSSYISDKVTYKANRAQCRQDSAEFEDMVFSLQDEMIKAHEAANPVETPDETEITE